MTVLIFVDTSKQIGTVNTSRSLRMPTEAWFAENDPEGVAFEYEVIKPPV